MHRVKLRMQDDKWEFRDAAVCVSRNHASGKDICHEGNGQEVIVVDHSEDDAAVCVSGHRASGVKEQQESNGHYKAVKEHRRDERDAAVRLYHRLRRWTIKGE